MFGKENFLKNPLNSSSLALKDKYTSLSYKKLNKLVTAVYMVTDILEKDEPLRLKLRTLSVEIISDTNHGQLSFVPEKVGVILSFFEIALTLDLISEMNFNILKKEFLDFLASVKAPRQIDNRWLEGFMFQPVETDESHGANDNLHKGQSIGHTLIHKDTNTKGYVPNKVVKANSLSFMSNTKNNFIILKQKRRDFILKIIEKNGGKSTIKDIKKNGVDLLKDVGDKTLQRELVSMVKNGVLNKTGEKRWSIYNIV